jgi:hypothetical protein
MLTSSERLNICKGWKKEMDKLKLLKLGTQKSPLTPDKYVGIEIEFLITIVGEEKLKALLIKDNLEDNVNLSRDGSVRDDRYDFEGPRLGKEIRLLVKETEAPEIIERVCACIKASGGYVNTTCGLHVHLDMRNRDVDLVYHNMYRVQSLMFKTQPMNRKHSTYCKPIDKNMIVNGTEERHLAINKQAYRKHKTLEIRLHEGTIDAKEIKMWVYFLIRMASINRKLTKFMRTFERFNLPPKVLEYMNGRIEKYARE